MRPPGSWAEIDARLIGECSVGGNNAAWGATAFAAPGETYGHYTEGNELRQIDDGPMHIARVGTKTGRSLWGHADMGGNVIELVLDVAWPIPATCDNCANVALPDPPQGCSTSR